MTVTQLLEEIEQLKARCPDKWQDMEVKIAYMPGNLVLHVKHVHRNYSELALIGETMEEIQDRTGVHDIEIG